MLHSPFLYLAEVPTGVRDSGRWQRPMSCLVPAPKSRSDITMTHNRLPDGIDAVVWPMSKRLSMIEDVAELAIMFCRAAGIVSSPIRVLIVIKLAVGTVSDRKQGLSQGVQTVQLVVDFELDNIMVWFCRDLHRLIREAFRFGGRDGGEAIWYTLTAFLRSRYVMITYVS